MLFIYIKLLFQLFKNLIYTFLIDLKMPIDLSFTTMSVSGFFKMFIR